MRSLVSSIRSVYSEHKKPSQYRSWSNNLKQVMKLKLNPLFEDLKTTTDQQRRVHLKQICDTLKGLDDSSCLDCDYVAEAGEQAIAQTKEVLLDLWGKLLDGIELVQVSEVNSIFFSVILWIMKRPEFDYARAPSLLLLLGPDTAASTTTTTANNNNNNDNNKEKEKEKEKEKGKEKDKTKNSQSSTTTATATATTSSASITTSGTVSEAGGSAPTGLENAAAEDVTYILASRYRGLLLATLRFVIKNIERAIDLCLPRKPGGAPALPISFLTAARRLRNIPGAPQQPAAPAVTVPSPSSQVASAALSEDKKAKKKAKRSPKKNGGGGCGGDEEQEQGTAPTAPTISSTSAAVAPPEQPQKKKKHRKGAADDEAAGGDDDKPEEKKKRRKRIESADAAGAGVGGDETGEERTKKKHRRNGSETVADGDQEEGGGDEKPEERKHKHKHGEKKKRKHQLQQEQEEEEEEDEDDDGDDDNDNNDGGDEKEKVEGDVEKDREKEKEKRKEKDQEDEEEEDKEGEREGENKEKDDRLPPKPQKSPPQPPQQQQQQQSLHTLLPRRAPTSVMTPLFTSFSTKVLAFVYFRFPYIQKRLISSITKDLVPNDEFKVDKPREFMGPQAIPSLLSYKSYNDAITKWNADSGKAEENNFDTLFAKRFLSIDNDGSDGSDPETEVDNWLDLLSHRSELFIEFFVEWISYVNSVTRSLKITFNWLELPGFYELLVSYFSLYKGRRTFSEEAISCPSVLSMLTEAAGLDEDPDADPQQQQQQQQQLQLQQQQQAQQRQKQQIPSKYFTACESSLLSIPDMRVINYLIRKAYTTASVFSISSLVSCYGMIETWLGNMNKHGVKVNDDFDVKFLCEGLDIVFKMDHYLLLTKVLAGLYNVADVFRGKVRAELFGAFLMDKYFYHLFFYWEENTRNIFMQLMLFKLLSVKRCQVRYEIKKRRKDKDFADTSLQPLAQAAAPSSTASSAGTGANNGSSSNNSSNNNSSSSTGGSSSAAAAAPSQGGDLPSPGGTMPIAPPSNFSDPANIVLLKRYDAFIRKIDETKAAMEADAQDVWSGELPLTQSASPQPSLHQHQQQSKKSKRGTSQTPPPTSLSQQQQQQQQQLEQDNSMGSKRRRKEFVVEEAPSVPLVNMVPGYVDSKEEEKEAGVANGRESTEVAITEGEVKAKTAQEKQEDEDDEKEKAEQAKQKEVDKEKEKENEKHQQQQHHQQVEGNTATANSNESDSKKRKRDKKTEKAEKKMAKKERKAAAQSGRTAAEEAIERVPEIPQSLLKYMEIAYSDYKCHLEKYKAWESKSIEPPKIISFN